MKNKDYAKLWGANKVHYGMVEVAYTCSHCTSRVTHFTDLRGLCSVKEIAHV